jgi:type IV pilus assembly protein PilM
MIERALDWLAGGGARKPLGIDLGTSSVKAVQMKRVGRAAVVTAAYSVEIPRGKAERPPLEAVAAAVAALVKGHALSADRFVSAFPLYSAIVRNTAVPFRGAGRIRQVIKFQAEPLIPFPIEEVLVDFHEARAAGENKTPVIIIAAKKDLVAKHLEILRGGGIDPEIVGLDAFALLNNYLLRARGAAAPEPAMLLEIGASKSVLVIVNDRGVLLARNIHIGGDDLTEAIQKELGVDFRTAEDLKKSAGSAVPPGNPSPEEAAVHRAIAPALARLNREVDRSIRSISATLAGAGVSRVHLSGGGALLRGTRELFAREFNCPADYLSSLAPFPGSPGEEEGCRMDTAAGLALQGLGLGKASVNLRREELSWTGGLGKAGRQFAAAAVLSLCIAAAMTYRFAASLMERRAEHASLAGQLERIYRDTFPSGGPVGPVSVAAEMEKRLEQYRAANKGFAALSARGVSSLEVLRDISRLIPEGLKIQVTDLMIGQEGVEMTGLLNNAGDADAVKAALKGSRFFDTVEIPSASASGSKQKFRLVATLRKAEAG